MVFNGEGQFKTEARNYRSSLVREYEHAELCFNEVLAACAMEEEFHKKFGWFEAFNEADRKMLADIDDYLGEGSIESFKPASSIRSSRSSRSPGSRNQFNTLEGRKNARESAESG